MAKAEDLQKAKLLPKANQCPKCKVGTILRKYSDDDPSCVNCGYIPPTITHYQNGTLSEREKFIINDALTEQYLRAKGNTRRSALPLTIQLNNQKAEEIENLMKKMEKLS